MSDIFSNLAAQNLDSRVGIQPLIPPLFAPASQLLPDITLPASHDQPAVAAENTIFSIAPSTVADEMGTSEKGQLSKEVITTEKLMLLPDLVSPDVSPKATSILSLRHLLHYHGHTYDGMEPVTYLSQASTPGPTIDESSSEDTLSTIVPQVNSTGDDISRQSQGYQHGSNDQLRAPKGGDDISRPSRGYQPLRKVDGAPLPQSTQSQEATQSNAGNSGMPHSAKPHDHQKRTEEKLHATAVNYDPQHTSQKDRSAVPISDIAHVQYPLPASDKPAVPLQIQPALSNSLPSLQTETRPEQIMNRDDELDQASSSLVQPQGQTTPVPVRRDRFIAPLVDVSISMHQASKARQQKMAEEWPEAPSQSLNGLDETTVEPLLDQHPGAKELELLQASQIAESRPVEQSVRTRFIEPTTPKDLMPNFSVSHAPNIQDVYDSSQDYSMGEANGAKTEDEAPPINITIGRVVVRATQAVQPAPAQKRVLRPAQSLNAYLKQRERGSR